jgi:predicted secreted hydrolase
MVHKRCRRILPPLGCFLVAAMLLLTQVTPDAGTSARSSAEADGFRLAEPGYQYEFPRDHGSHDEFRTEWWYYTGHLSTQKGRRFGFQVTFFRRAMGSDQSATLPSRWAIRHLYLAHFAVSDIEDNQFLFSEKISREGLGKAGAETGRLHVWVDGWVVEGTTEEPLNHRVSAEQDGVAVELTLHPLKQPIIHGRAGVSRKGEQAGQASHYYSLTRMATEGRLTIDGETFQVTGTSWMDHEFGSADLSEDLVGWDWFSLQLDDRSELMVYLLRRADGSLDPASSGTVVFPDGRSETLASGGDVNVTVRSHWTSPMSGARYPAAWHIACPSLRLDVDVTPLMADQELATRRSTQVTYWEGAVRMAGTSNGRSVTGQGYVELTGYAERFRERL